jgi:hypothetical protein
MKTKIYFLAALSSILLVSAACSNQEASQEASSASSSKTSQSVELSKTSQSVELVGVVGSGEVRLDNGDVIKVRNGVDAPYGAEIAFRVNNRSTGNQTVQDIEVLNILLSEDQVRRRSTDAEFQKLLAECDSRFSQTIGKIEFSGFVLSISSRMPFYKGKKFWKTGDGLFDFGTTETEGQMDKPYDILEVEFTAKSLADSKAISYFQGGKIHFENGETEYLLSPHNESQRLMEHEEGMFESWSNGYGVYRYSNVAYAVHAADFKKEKQLPPRATERLRLFVFLHRAKLAASEIRGTRCVVELTLNGQIDSNAIVVKKAFTVQ